jgi:hypothetical protein
MQISKFYILRPSIAIEIGEAEAAILEKIAVYCSGSLPQTMSYFSL